jgi:hypothetical protein
MCGTAYAGCASYIHGSGDMAVGLNTLETIKGAIQSEPALCKPKLYKVQINVIQHGARLHNMACAKTDTLFNQTWLMSNKAPLRHTNMIIHKMAAYQHKCPANGFSITGYSVATALHIEKPVSINLFTHKS